MTAKECLNQWDNVQNYERKFFVEDNAEKAMIKFAIYHVDKALKTAADAIDNSGFSADLKIILSAYPMTNIK